MRSLLYKAMSNFYPKWIYKINPTPSKEEYINSFRILYGYHPDECEVKIGSGGASIITPTDACYDGSYIKITDSPKLSNKSFFYSGCGPTWDIDDNGDRFYLIDKLTMKPANWEEVKHIRIIFNYFDKASRRENILNKLLDQN